MSPSRTTIHRQAAAKTQGWTDAADRRTRRRLFDRLSHLPALQLMEELPRWECQENKQRSGEDSAVG